MRAEESSEAKADAPAKVNAPVKVDAPVVKSNPAKFNTPVKTNAPKVNTTPPVVTKVAKKSDDAPIATGAGIATSKVATKKVANKGHPRKNAKKNKMKNRFGFTAPNATLGTNLGGFVDKYGFGGQVNASMQYEDMDGKQQQTLKGFDAKTQAEIVKLKARYPQADNLLSALLADVAASKASGQNHDSRQDIKFKDLEKRLYDLEQKLNSKVTEELTEAEYQGRKVKLGKPMRGDVKKFKVYVKDPKTGNVKKVNFGHGGTSAKKKGEKTMKIKKSDPARRKSFRARHNCDNPGPRTKARYWSCRAW